MSDIAQGREASAPSTRWSRVVVLGGAGLLGRTIAERLRRDGELLLIADRRNPTDHGAEFKRVDVTERGTLRGLIDQVGPDLVVNAVNLATLYSERGHAGYDGMIRYHAELFEALARAPGKVTYLQIGTTGSGGLGFDIPFTHGGPVEDMPIIHKAAFAGMASQLLVMIARSFSRERVRIAEVKPGLAIFGERVLAERHRDLSVVTVDGGESGVYTRDELALLTCYMGYTTAGRVADKVMAALAGHTTTGAVPGHDITRAIDGTIISEEPEDRALRDALLASMSRLTEGALALPATGNLGPPTITRDLTLAAAVLAGQGPDGPLVSDAFDYVRATRPGLGAWLATQELDLALSALEARAKEWDATEPWALVHRVLEARER